MLAKRIHHDAAEAAVSLADCTTQAETDGHAYGVVIDIISIIIIIILYTYIAHQTIKVSPMLWMRILTEQECFLRSTFKRGNGMSVKYCLPDLAGILGKRMASTEGGPVQCGVGYGEGSPSSRLGRLGERRELPNGDLGTAPAENGFWRNLKATERSFLYLCNKI